MQVLKRAFGWGVMVAALLGVTLAAGPAPAAAAAQGFNASKVADMTGFDPTKFENPTGDMIKIGVLAPFSGPAAAVGQLNWACLTWVATDINRRGGIMVDGAKKKIALFKGDTMGKPATTKQATEQLCLKDKVDVLWGTSGSHLTAIIQAEAAKYKKLHVNAASLSDTLMEGKAFTPYTFQYIWPTYSVGMTLGKYFATRPERKFYILNQDYIFGHQLADSFKAGLKKYVPDAQIVGEDYHPLFNKDFAPYLTKVKASGAEVIFTGDWMPDSSNLIKQSRQMGIDLPFAGIFLDDIQTLIAVGDKGSEGLIFASQLLINYQDGIQAKWHDAWKTWPAPFNTPLYEWLGSTTGSYVEALYWMVDVMERAGSTDPQKVTKVWENEEWNGLIGETLTMRGCDHRVVRDTYVTVFVHPNKWYKDCSFMDQVTTIPAEFVTLPQPKDSDRCK
ncbi:MAG: ABC transporter substrate-binding protein [Deltaproteobacteria bacterium]|nr:ABC transporter substrate-binding protein [Deltaproteobacteria bacterium]